MSTRTERAAAIRTEISSILDAADIAAPVTSDARDIDKRGAGRTGIVLVSPGPRLDWPANLPSVTRSTWTVYLLARPGAAVDIWEPIDLILDALIAAGFRMDSAEPGEYERPDDAGPLTGYVITITEDTLT